LPTSRCNDYAVMQHKLRLVAYGADVFIVLQGLGFTFGMTEIVFSPLGLVSSILGLRTAWPTILAPKSS